MHGTLNAAASLKVNRSVLGGNLTRKRKLFNEECNQTGNSMHPRKFRSLELIIAGLVLALVVLLAVPLFSGFPSAPIAQQPTNSAS
ncbi:MAG: hypothetical protein KDD70_05860 [Bdellovibrionales bacterium]|nr:hypothetical protein [Bdellovibrionales bacterium]